MMEKQTNPNIQKSEERLKIIEKIKQYEKEGKFDQDVEDDPPTITLTPEKVDYLNEKLTSKAKNRFANRIGERFLNEIIENKQLIVKEIRGLENMEGLESGALITCNHFNPFDSFAVEEAFRNAKLNKKQKLFIVLREGNYTNFPGFYGFLFRNCNTLPLSSNKRTMVKFMEAADIILQRGDFILIFPEQSMWWNYKKPKPLKIGAYKIAARNNVPILPIFITMEDSNVMGEDGFYVQEYTVNIGKPIFPDENLTEKENLEIMKEKNIVAEEVYELENSEEQIRFELFKVIQNNFVINKCENCGRLFIPVTSSNNPNQKARNDQKYCNNLYLDTGKTCREIGATNKHKEKVENSDILKEYKKEYKKIYGRHYSHLKKFTEKQFKQWSKKAIELRDSFDDSQIEEFKNELRKLCQSYF